MLLKTTIFPVSLSRCSDFMTIWNILICSKLLDVDPSLFADSSSFIDPACSAIPARLWIPACLLAPTYHSGFGSSGPKIQKLTNKKRLELMHTRSCFICREQGHIVSECPVLARKEHRAIKREEVSEVVEAKSNSDCSPYSHSHSRKAVPITIRTRI